MEVRHLELLRELGDRGSVTAVAAATHRTPSAVSQQLRTAQQEFGVPLVEPDGRGIRLTEAGQVLARSAIGVATAIETAQSQWDAFRNAPRGYVSVAGLPSATEYLLPATLRDLADEAIEVRYRDVDVAEAQYAPLTIDYDIVIAHTLVDRPPEGAAGLRTARLLREPLDIALSNRHRLASRALLTPEEVARETWVGVPSGYPFDTVLQAIEAHAGRELRVTQRIKDNRVVEALVAGEYGIAILPRFTTQRREGIVLRPLAGVRTARYIFALMRRDRAERRTVRRAIDALTRVARAIK